MANEPPIVSVDGCWTWFNGPRVAYSAARDRLYYGGLRADGKVTVASWDIAGRLLRVGRPRTTVVQDDDHDNPALCVLDDGSLLAAYSVHNGSSWSNRTGTDGDVRSWGTEVQANDGATNQDAYAHLFQVGDTAGTIYWFFRRTVGGSGRPRYFRTSTDRGATWNSPVELLRYSTERPYVVAHQTSSTRIDFLVSNGQPNETTNSLYHFFMTVASNGTRSYFRSDGTSIGGDGVLPLTPTNMTLVWNGATANSWNWDITTIGGNPVVAFATFPGSDVHKYHQGRWSGSAWVVEEVCEGGDAGTTPHYLYAAETQYSGGIGLDPNDADAIYVSRKYGSANWRVEKWTHAGTFGSGTWSKAEDTSGNTGTVNGRPWCPRGVSPTTVFWWEGSYTTYIAFDTRLRASPTFNWRLAKTATPSWNSAEAPAGAQAYYLLREGTGNPQDLSGNARHGTVVGTPTWNAGTTGDHGAYLSGFTTANYVQINAVGAAFPSTTFPQWCAVLIKSSSSGTGQYVVGLGRSSNNAPLFGLNHNQGSVDQQGAVYRGDDNVLAQPTSTVDANDGNYHCLLAVRESATRLVFYADGRGLNSSSVSTGSGTFDRGALGLLLRASAAMPFGGQLHAAVFGWGSAPDPEWMGLDFLRGQFAGTFATAAAVVPGTFLHHLRRRRVS